MRSVVSSRSRSQYTVIGSPFTSSSKYGRPASVAA